MTPKGDAMSDEFSRGEIQRSLARLEQSMSELRAEVRDRHHKLSGEVASVIGPMSTLKVQMSNAEINLVRLDDEVRDVTKQASRISGIGAVLAIFAGIAPWPWKH